MQINNFIRTKENSETHTKEEIEYFITHLNSFSQEEIILWLKAVKANGLNDEETSFLTLAMANSGNILSWEGLEPTLDKHSTGGIGDKITLLFIPVIAAYNEIRINAPKLSGRSLGISGGTIDKLESIPGFQTNLTLDEMKKQVKEIGCVICSANVNLAPADKKLYAIRDISNTVDSIPLIASSVMSKKIAGGAKNIILDVKFGSGAFMKSFEDAKLLANKMVDIGKSLNKNIRAVISDMNQPLGFKIGNALEIEEVIEVLSGKKVEDLIEITLELVNNGINLVNSSTKEDLTAKTRELLLSGKALNKFREMVSAQKGNLDLFKQRNKAKHIEFIKATNNGYIESINAFMVGKIVHEIGAGRFSTSDDINHSVGIVLHKKVGNEVKKDELLLEIHAQSEKDIEKVKNEIGNAVQISEVKIKPRQLIVEVIK